MHGERLREHFASERTPTQDFPYKVIRFANGLLSRWFKVTCIRESSLYPWQLHQNSTRAFVSDTVPAGASEYLRTDNPRLGQLQQMYEALDERVIHSPVWIPGKLTSEELVYFRGHNPFMSQIGGGHLSELGYALSYYAVKASPAGDLLATFDEDGLFGAFTFDIDGRRISRDVLDSAREIDFIRTHVGLSAPNTQILDIGAGYGRLVHRLNEVTDLNVAAYATDAFAPSTFICEYYLAFRGLPNETVVPLPDVDEFLAAREVRLATNIHSFSECTLDAVDWWVSRLSRFGVRYLMVVPNVHDSRAESGACLTNNGEDMEPLFAARGYKLCVRERRFQDPVVQRYGVDGSWISLFELRN